MSWLFSQALVEEYLGDISLDGEQSVQSNGNPIQLAYLSQDKMKKYSRLSRFGMMFKPLTENLGQELLMSYLEDFHVKTSALLEGGGELLEAEVPCGNKWRELLATYDPNSCLWKTAQCSLLEDLEQSLEIWPKWGSMRNGECYRQPMLAQTILEKESGFWPTPNTLEGLKPKKIERIMEYNQKARPGRSYAAMNLREQVAYGKQPIWPSPKARDYKDGTTQGTMNRTSPDLGKVVGQSKTTGSLNPMWVEWLMGWPLGWTDLKPLEMDKSHFARQQLGKCLEKD